MTASVQSAYERGLDLIGREEYFAAHEALEEAWRAAAGEERDFFQGLVHVAVAWHHARVTGRRIACERQLEKAARRLAPYAPAHRGLDIAALVEELAAASGRFPRLPTPRLRRARRDG